MHGFAHGFVAAEGETDVRHAAGNMGVRQGLADHPGGFEKRDGVIGVFFDAGGDGENVGIEDDVFGREAIIDQGVIGARADFVFALCGVGLALLVKRHHDGGGAIAADFAGLL